MAFSVMRASESFATRFPLKLWRMLNTCSSGAICWGEHGRSIKIDRRRFEREYLMTEASTFKTSNFSSFVRQLNLYGFRKIVNSFRFSGVEDFGSDADLQEYHHPFFRRSHPDLLNRVQRRMKGKKDGHNDTENNRSSWYSTNLKRVQVTTAREPMSTIELNIPSGLPAIHFDKTAMRWSTLHDNVNPGTSSFVPSIPLRRGNAGITRSRPWIVTNSHPSSGPVHPSRVPYTVAAVPTPSVTFTPAVSVAPSSVNVGLQPVIIDKQLPDMICPTTLGLVVNDTLVPNTLHPLHTQYLKTMIPLLSHQTGQSIDTGIHDRTDHSVITVNVPTQSLITGDSLPRSEHTPTSVSHLVADLPNLPLPVLPLTNMVNNAIHMAPDISTNNVTASSSSSIKPFFSMTEIPSAGHGASEPENFQGYKNDFGHHGTTAHMEHLPANTNTLQLSSVDHTYQSVGFQAMPQLTKAPFLLTADYSQRGISLSTPSSLSDSTIGMKEHNTEVLPGYIMNIGEVKVEIAKTVTGYAQSAHPAFTPAAE